MSGFITSVLFPSSTAANRGIEAANLKRTQLNIANRNKYQNKVPIYQQQIGAANAARQYADADVYQKALQTQYAAFQGFEAASRMEGQLTGPTGEGSRLSERGITSKYLELLSKRQDIEFALSEATGADFHKALRLNAVRNQNEQIAAKNKLGQAPTWQPLAKKKRHSLVEGLFNVAKLGASIYTGGMAGGSFDLGKGISAGLGSFKST